MGSCPTAVGSFAAGPSPIQPLTLPELTRLAQHPTHPAPALQHPAAAARALSREGLGELLAAALHLMLDPAAAQLQDDLDAGGPFVSVLVVLGFCLCMWPAAASPLQPSALPPLAPRSPARSCGGAAGGV